MDLLLAAGAARTLGAQHLALFTPHLASMRQDMASNPGEAISQRIVGGSLADHIATLHRDVLPMGPDNESRQGGARLRYGAAEPAGSARSAPR